MTVFVLDKGNTYFFDSFGGPSILKSETKYVKDPLQFDGWSCVYWGLVFIVFFLKFRDFDQTIDFLKKNATSLKCQDYLIKMVFLAEVPDSFYMSPHEFNTIFKYFRYAENPVKIEINHLRAEYFIDIYNPVFIKPLQIALEYFTEEGLNFSEKYTEPEDMFHALKHNIPEKLMYKLYMWYFRDPIYRNNYENYIKYIQKNNYYF